MSLPSDIETCHKLILAQHEQIQMLVAKIVELEARVNANSSNSHRPPSSDGLKKQPALPKKEKTNQGGQKGHKGDTLKMVEQVDHVEELCPARCTCGASLAGVPKRLMDKRQVFDIPPPKLEVTEYRQMFCCCPKCGRIHCGEFPRQVGGPAQYGNRVRALAVLLNVDYKLPVAKIGDLLGDLYGYTLNEGTSVAATQRCYDLLQPIERAIRSQLLASAANHFDETGIRCAGKLHWLHDCSNALFTSLFAHPKRGRQALESEDSILPQYEGWSLHDFFASYFLFLKSRHAACNAHILRELMALEEQGHCWAGWFRSLLLTLYQLTDQGQGVLSPDQLAKAQSMYQTIWNYADEQEPPPKATHKKGRKKATKGRNLLIRLDQYREAVLAFAQHQVVPFTNNQAERDLRPAKIKLKVAGSFRTFKGAQIYARIQGFISTVRKHQFSAFNELVAVFNDQPISIPC